MPAERIGTTFKGSIKFKTMFPQRLRETHILLDSGSAMALVLLPKFSHLSFDPLAEMAFWGYSLHAPVAMACYLGAAAFIALVAIAAGISVYRQNYARLAAKLVYLESCIAVLLSVGPLIMGHPVHVGKLLGIAISRLVMISSFSKLLSRRLSPRSS